MRVFKNFNQFSKKPCPICGTTEDKETVLIAIADTGEGWTHEALQVHLDCIELFIYPDTGIIAQKYRDDEK